MKIQNEHNFRKALTEGLNLLLGSGFSVAAKNRDDTPLPTGRELRNELIAEFKMDNVSSLDLPKICTILDRSQRKSFQAYLRRRFIVRDFHQDYLLLDKINVKSIFTTNIDNLLHKIWQKCSNHYLNDIDLRGPTFHDRNAIDLVYLHGCILYPRRPLTFSALDVAAAFRFDPDRWHYLTQRLQAYPTVFWGTSISDADILEALHPMTVHGRPHEDKWMVVSSSDDEANLEYYNALEFQIIEADTLEILDYLKHADIRKSSPDVTDSEASTSQLFPKEAIPDIASVHSRPIVDFYLGAAPSWYDIFSGNLHRTQHYGKIRDAINSGKHTVVIGLPACGKTTLLMQVAADIRFSGHKLVCESLSTEQADLIICKLNGKPALVFIDNFADSIFALKKLAREPNIRVAVFDRDYNFERIAHRLTDIEFQLVDVTELSSYEIQSILSKIPTTIAYRRPSTKIRTAKGMPISIFELIEANITKPTLRKRFRSVLKHLSSENEDLLNLLLLCCYVHSCRTPVSMDMLLAFFRDKVESYEDIYRMCQQLGAMIEDYVGELADTEQDHFIPRSIIIAEAVMEQASGVSLRRMLRRFCQQVSRCRICRYDIFKRKAFDADIMKKAFPDWQEGKEFYTEVYSLDPSPFTLQQMAIYLSRKKQHREAFKWIDRAITQSGGRILSIRNSHAIILFNANIEAQETDGTVEATLRHSMEILESCYSLDVLKLYHVIVYSENALMYCERYVDETAQRYLRTASKWLKLEAIRFPWNRRIKRLIQKISDALERLQGEIVPRLEL